MDINFAMIFNLISRYDPSSSDTEGKKIDKNELKKIRIEFRRKIDDDADKLERDIVEPEDVTVIRRDGNVKNIYFLFFIIKIHQVL